jgi:SEC-C motif-containing protein
MRSRYAAFALGEAEYLVRTLHPTHADLSLPRADLLRSLRGARTRLSYPSLAILDHREHGATAEVLFAAGIRDAGRDASFVELSDFTRERDAGSFVWTYVSGILVPRSELGRDPAGLTIDAFLALASA